MMTAVAVLLATAGWALPFNTDLFVFVGHQAEIRLAPGAVDTVPVVVRPYTTIAANVASLELRLSWDPSLVTVEEALPGPFGSVTLNQGELASGELRAGLFNAIGDTVGFDALEIVLRAGASEALAHVDVEVLGAGSELGEDMTDLVTTRGLAVCVGVDGVLGEVTGDGVMDVMDARELARWALGLAVDSSVSQAVSAGLGDGNEDGTTNVVDAQQVARYAAGSPVTGRVGQSLQGSCAGAAPPVFFVDLAAGEDHACALSEEGDVYCWGDNRYGQLGVGTTNATLAPVRALMPGPATAIDASGIVTCALADDGAAYCWGSNNYGRVGRGTVGGAELAPSPVVGGLAFEDIEVGERAVCGRTGTGALYCWGENNDSILGRDVLADCPSGGPCIGSPTAVHPSYTFSDISLGLFHACGILTDGSPVCWGNNEYGQVGVDSLTDAPVADPITPEGGFVFDELTVGAVHTCGVTLDGSSYCWGTDLFGSLGLGGDSVAVPTEIPGVSFREFALSQENTHLQHSCALTDDGAAWCWGFDIQGGVGSNAPTSTCTFERFGSSYTADCYDTPVPVDGALTFQQLELGENFTCGLTTVGRIFCWGANDTGQLGDGTTEDRQAPVATLRPGLGITVHGVSGAAPGPALSGSR